MTPSNGARACHSASNAVVPQPRLGPSSVSAEAIHRPFTSSRRTSTEKALHERRCVCTNPSCTAPDRTRESLLRGGAKWHRLMATCAPRCCGSVSDALQRETPATWIVACAVRPERRPTQRAMRAMLAHPRGLGSTVGSCVEVDEPPRTAPSHLPRKYYASHARTVPPSAQVRKRLRATKWCIRPPRPRRRPASVLHSARRAELPRQGERAMAARLLFTLLAHAMWSVRRSVNVEPECKVLGKVPAIGCLQGETTSRAAATGWRVAAARLVRIRPADAGDPDATALSSRRCSRICVHVAAPPCSRPRRNVRHAGST
jgi:hypothetical protein